MVKLIVKKVNDDEIFQDFVRVHRSHREGIEIGRVVKLTVNGKTVLRVTRKAQEGEEGAIWIDYLTRKRLGVSPGEAAEFQIRRASWFDELWWTWNATDPALRASARVSAISFILGLIGLALGVLSLL